MKYLKTIRLARGLTQAQCCDRLSNATGKAITLERWMRWENGKNDPRPAMRNAIADMLGCTLDQLAGRAPFHADNAA